MNIYDIFKIGIYECRLDLDIEKLQAFCNEHQQKDPGRIISNVGGYQSNDLDLSDSILTSLIKEIQTHSNNYARDVLHGASQTVDALWFNVNGYKDSNISHNHFGGISGAYYIKTPENCGELTFDHPAKDILGYYDLANPPQIQDKMKVLDSYNSSMMRLPVIENRLYLFPGWLNHFVEPNMNKTEERISISFNISQSK
jgi:uncharacterized protein (TIGR02466 family)